MAKPLGRRESCPSCEGDLHICYHCDFYDPQSYNQCRESSAERVLEKDKSNFCDYFKVATTGKVQATQAGEAKAKLEALFKKR